MGKLPNLDTTDDADIFESSGFLDDGVDSDEDADTTPTTEAESPVAVRSSKKAKAKSAAVADARTAPTVDFANSDLFATDVAWVDFRLPRPLLRALADLDYRCPTVIQRQAIPHALEGRDVLGTAPTGTGKTAAFVLPTLARIMQCPPMLMKGSLHATKALILLPTRELARQCFEVVRDLGQHAGHVTNAIIFGGMSNMKQQEKTLSLQPNIIVATPGRVVDMLLNTASFDLDALEVVVFDEADHLLGLGFRKQCLEIVSKCADSRQVLLFSATLSPSIKELAALTLRQPVWVQALSKHVVKLHLQQEFALIESEEKGRRIRLAALYHLLASQGFCSLDAPVVEGKPTATSGRKRKATAPPTSEVSEKPCKRAIVFFPTRAEAQFNWYLSSLVGVQGVLPLHSDLPQEIRNSNLEKFRNFEASVLFATDVAGRGLDIPFVDLIINLSLPKDETVYVHRIGRTARLGRPGTAISIILSDERTTAKKLSKSCPTDVPSRTVRLNAEVLNRWVTVVKASWHKAREAWKSEQADESLKHTMFLASKAEKVVVTSTGESAPHLWIQDKENEKKEKRRRLMKSGGGRLPKDNEKPRRSFDRKIDDPFEL